MSHEEEIITAIGARAWKRVESILRVGAPDVLRELPEGGSLYVDATRMPPVVAFSFEDLELVLFYDPATDSVAEVHADGSERAWDGAGEPLPILEPPPGSARPDLNEDAAPAASFRRLRSAKGAVAPPPGKGAHPARGEPPNRRGAITFHAPARHGS